MPVTIRNIEIQTCSKAQLIGKRYDGAPNWGEWWANDWFAALEKQPRHPFNEDAFLGAVRIIDGRPERWIGMLFPPDAEAPEGFEKTQIEDTVFAVVYLCGKEGSSDFYTMETHEMCLGKLKEMNLIRKENDWCIERYQCPRFTAPDEAGNVVLDYAIAVQK
ncbi:MAG: hypothetical protein E7322_00580 [Clostridiales bacterium]|nr:hypothetical protein [Clostridiales bacterium]